MARRHLRRAGAGALATVALLASATPSGAATGTGPSTATSPYLLPSAPGVDVTSLLTVEDGVTASDGYDWAGIPDGIGLTTLRGEHGEHTQYGVAYVNHELRPDRGAVRRHGQKGAFVSRLVIDRATGEVVSGSDWINPGVWFYDYPSRTWRQDVPSGAGTSPAGKPYVAQGAAFNRFCSASLTEPGQLYNPVTGNGYDGQVFFANEEAGDEGRAFGVLENGDAFQLPRLGLHSWENTLAAPNRSDTTLVIGNEDGGDGQLRVYVGRKTATGRAVDMAGLTNGANFAVALDAPVTTDAGFRSTFGTGVPATFHLAAVDWDQSGAGQNADAKAAGLTLIRIEDGVFDPSNPDDFYFLTTEGSPEVGAVPSRDGGGVWRLRFADIERPELGGTLTLLLDGTEAPYLNKPDNLGIDTFGHLLIQEDPGNNAHLARIVAHDLKTGRTAVLATFDPARFSGPGAITQDEESSGIVDGKDVFGQGSFLFDAQVHRASADPAHVELGQLLLLQVTNWERVFASS